MSTRLDETQVNIQWLPSVATYQDLLDFPQNELRDGLVCMVRDTDKKYTYDAPTQSWVLPNINKDQLYNFDIPDIEDEDVGSVVIVNNTKDGLKYVSSKTLKVFKGASSFNKLSSQSVSGRTPTIVTWDVVSDSFGFLTSADTLTIPPGVAFVRMVLNLRVSNVDKGRLYYIQLIKNGNLYYEQEYVFEGDSKDRFLNVNTRVFQVSQGDSFQVILYQGSNSSKTILADLTSWQVEVVD